MVSRAVRREGRCKQITLVCARSVSATRGLPPLAAHTAQALGCPTGNRPRPALSCMYLPGLSRSGSGTRVVLKGADSVGPVFCALPRSKQLRRLDAWQVHSPQVGSASYHLPGSSHSVSWMCSGSAISGVPCVSFGELISGCDPPGRHQPSRIPGRLG